MEIQEMLKMERDNLKEFTLLDRVDGCVSGKKILKHHDKLHELSKCPRKATPITIEFHPSNVCNHRCPNCVFGLPNVTSELKKVMFDMKLLDQLIFDFQDLKVKAIGISGGGEPLCHPDIISILNNFCGYFDVGIVSNGSLLNEAKAECIVKTCKWCRISVDAGSQQVYEGMHGKGNSFSEIVSKIKMLAEIKQKAGSIITLGVSFLLTPGNFLDMFKAINIFREIPGINYFQIKPIVVSQAERQTNPNMIFWDRRIFQMLEAVKLYETDIFKIYSPSYKFINMMVCEHTGLQFRKCWGHPFYPTVAADGSVLVCCYFLNHLFAGKDEGCYGKITKERGFADLWNDPKRFEIGEAINTKLCPCNCKLSETNTTLEELNRASIIHENFIN